MDLYLFCKLILREIWNQPSVASCQYAVDDLYTTEKIQPEHWPRIIWTLDVAAEVKAEHGRIESYIHNDLWLMTLCVFVV